MLLMYPFTKYKLLIVYIHYAKPSTSTVDNKDDKHTASMVGFCWNK